jgi:hypothetical protein
MILKPISSDKKELKKTIKLMSILKFSDWKKQQTINEDLDMTQNLKDLEMDRTDAQAIISRIDSIKTITTPEQLDSTKESVFNQYKDKKGTATVAALSLLDLESQHRLYQIKTQDASKKFTETITSLDETIKSLKDKATANPNE